MTENIKSIFEHNMKLLGEMDKAIYYFREQQYDKALGLVANSIDQIRYVIEAIVYDREYFNLVATESLLEMLTGIIEAKKNKDYILLADLLELQLINFIIGVQELIISKEEIIFNEDNYKKHIKLLLEKGTNFSEELLVAINTEHFLENGYRVEFSSGGQMTLAAENEGSQFYFHSNHKVIEEAFILAKQWFQTEKKCYVIYGLGMGYHIKELQALAKDAMIEVFEADLNVIQLACAFSDVEALLNNDNISFIYDPEFTGLKERILNLGPDESFTVHYPSFKNVKNDLGKELLVEAFPWYKMLEVS